MINLNRILYQGEHGGDLTYDRLAHWRHLITQSAWLTAITHLRVVKWRAKKAMKQ